MRWCKVALVLGVIALAASPVLAQGRRGFGGFGGPGMLLGVEKVQKDLGLDKDKVAKATEALQKVREDNRDELGKLRDASPEERAEIMKKFNDAQTKALAGVLDEKQMKRLHQIQLQQQGVNMFQDEEVQKKLSLTAEQKDQIKTINEDLQKDIQEMFSGGKPGPEAFTKIAGLRKEALAKAEKTLKDDQKKTLKEVLGEPLELKPEDFPRGGRGGKPDKPRTDF
jgi:hypothetical protein